MQSSNHKLLFALCKLEMNRCYNYLGILFFQQKAVPVAIVQSTRSPLAPLTRLSIDSVKYQDEHLSILLEDTDSAESNVKSCDDQLSIKEMVKKYSTPKTRPCSVLLQRLPQAELKKFGL